MVASISHTVADEGSGWSMNFRRVAPAIVAAAAMAVGAGVGAAAAQTKPVVHLASAHHAAVFTVNAVIEVGSQDHKGGPALIPGNLTLPANTEVRMVIRSYDDGPAGAPGHTAIQGVAGGAILLNGKPVKSVPANQIAHTFTVPAIGLNVPIPAAPTGRSITVAFTFKTPKAGSYTWQCYALCGNGDNGWGYPMTTPDMMRGTVVVR
jgi:heme/copper-type cytochrome/quinol oxidase subunit 2